ncbi:pyridoxal phosphate-dependent aminotransferase [Marinigracilibium pacificum]|uniref:alanine transaminase n=1 Tax=Marinigracilibium pacificum TaxID=2729599 RepID=A0A848J3K2_9BACT|nr:pyridoxal phosphate-dependent aminotransferase [Marinigracilibium pacificum]NMM49110.1 pyridoxal phosphate-dependent aminotransferase [Marinigracilibium pacificum]
MRQKLLSDGSKELNYEIRGIVSKAEQLNKLGRKIYWENIGDPIQKNHKIPTWMKDEIGRLIQEDNTYGYCHSMGVLATREYLAEKTNSLGGCLITSEDILFFNGLGDAISTVYQFIETSSRIIGPSPSYSTHSSAEAAHASQSPVTYLLDPDNNWYPDIDDLYNKVKYNPAITGILIINPDNPTGMVYPTEILMQMIEIAKEFDLLIIADEIYENITYNNAKTSKLSQIIGDHPGISMKGISKEMPWPGSRCGWIEFYNRSKNSEFDKFAKALINAKMIEVCATKLPQLAIPKIYENTNFKQYRVDENAKIGQKSRLLESYLSGIPGIKFNRTNGAFYNSIIFEENVIDQRSTLRIENSDIRKMIEKWVSQPGIKNDQRFVYYLLGAYGICVVPISSFCSDLNGFRITLLEDNEETCEYIYSNLRKALLEYLRINQYA